MSIPGGYAGGGGRIWMLRRVAFAAGEVPPWWILANCLVVVFLLLEIPQSLDGNVVDLCAQPSRRPDSALVVRPL